MVAAGIKSHAVLDELESHLREDVELQVRSGVAVEEAFERAVQRVGAADKLKQEFAKVSRPQAPFSRRKVRIGCTVVAVFIFLVQTWTLMIYEISRGELLFGLGLNAVVAFYIGVLPDLNRMWPGVRGWELRKAVATACNFAVALWVCLLLLSVANVIRLPSGIIFGVVCWSLCGAAAATVVVIAHGTEPDVLNLWTSEAWQSFEIAGVEASRFHHDFIGTEHVLLGLLESENSCVPNVLRKMGVSRETVRGEIEKIVGNGPQSQTNRTPPYTPRAMKALKLAILEAKALRCDRVDAGHIFLGLLREGGGVAARVLSGLGVNATKARAEVCEELAKRKDANE